MWQKKKSRWTKICISYLVYCHIWLNLLPEEDCHFFSTSSYGWSPLWLQTKIPKKTHTGAQQLFFQLEKSTKKRNNKWKTWKSSDFGGFQWPEMRGQKSQNLPYFHIWFKVCKKNNYKEMNKDLYFIFGL